MKAKKSSAARRSSASSNEDTPLLSQLYERYKRPIYTYVYRLLGNLEDADDLTQEVFIRACSTWENLHDRDNLSAWLYRIATNLCVDHLRRRKRITWLPLLRKNQHSERLGESVEEEALYLPSSDGDIPGVAERELIRLALAQLQEEYAVVLVLSAAQGVPYQEIATIVGISPNAAATRISRAKKMFIEQYQRLAQEGVGRQESIQ
ncbi:MAG TPA: RNA polymerase sigma factor [Ktedonobacteraceae bacterium]|nr:RNA polymerase sigma factor [Ktedonobacteraceae bacterium]